MPSTLPSTLLAGPWQTGEFPAVRDSIDPLHQLPALPTLAETIAYIKTLDLPPELVLLAQPRPGVDEQANIDKLCQLTPLTRLVIVAGSWCEGELRTGKPLVDVVRLYWYEFPVWWRAACERLALGECPMWSEPLVDVRSGAIVPIREGEAPAEPRAGTTLAIDAIDYTAFAALANGLNALGWNCIWRPRHRPNIGGRSSTAGPSCSPGLWPGAPLHRDKLCPGEELPPGKARGCNPEDGSTQLSMDEHPPTAAIWDGGQLDERELNELRNFCGRVDNAPVIALLDFPRVEHLTMAKSAGATAIMAKPYQLALLNSELTRLTQASLACEIGNAFTPEGRQACSGGR